MLYSNIEAAAIIGLNPSENMDSDTGIQSHARTQARYSLDRMKSLFVGVDFEVLIEIWKGKWDWVSLIRETFKCKWKCQF